MTSNLFHDGTDAVPPDLFTGRREVTTAFKELLGRARSGAREVWIVAGRRGSGKSSLARYLAASDVLGQPSSRCIVIWFSWDRAKGTDSLDWELYRDVLSRCSWDFANGTLLRAKTVQKVLDVYNTIGIFVGGIFGGNLSTIQTAVRSGKDLVAHARRALRTSDVTTIVLLLDDADKTPQTLAASCQIADEMANAGGGAGDVNCVVSLLVHPGWDRDLSRTMNPARHVRYRARLDPFEREDVVSLINRRCTVLGWEAEAGSAETAYVLSGGIPHIMGGLLSQARAERSTVSGRPLLTTVILEDAIWTSTVVLERLRSELTYRELDVNSVETAVERDILCSFGRIAMPYRSAASGLTEGEWRRLVTECLGAKAGVTDSISSAWQLLRDKDVLQQVDGRYRFCAEAIRLKLPALLT